MIFVSCSTSRIPIGVGEERDGVYYCNGAPKMKNQVNIMISQELWHNRMGHPSSEVSTIFLKSLGITSTMNNNAHGVCEACLRAKQSRAHFFPSMNKANLVHCDIWRPYQFLLYVARTIF